MASTQAAATVRPLLCPNVPASATFSHSYVGKPLALAKGIEGQDMEKVVLEKSQAGWSRLEHQRQRQRGSDIDWIAVLVIKDIPTKSV